MKTVEEVGVDEMGVDKMGNRRSGNKLHVQSIAENRFNLASFEADSIVEGQMSLVAIKPVFRVSDLCPTQTGLYSHRRWLEA